MTGADVYRDGTLNEPHAGIRTIQELLKRNGLLATTGHPENITNSAREKRLAFVYVF